MDYSEIRGFNYQPGYASNGIQIWLNFKEEQVEKEIARGKELFPNINALRLWLSFDAYIQNAELFMVNFTKMMNVLGKYSVKAMPVLFNNWHSIPDFGGVSAEQVAYWNQDKYCEVYMNYIESVVGAFALDPRILVWDLCNEPFNSGREDVFLPWLEKLYIKCKELNAKAPVTIGVPPGLDFLKLVEPICDVLTPHLYFTLKAGQDSEQEKESYKHHLDRVIEFAQYKGKPIFAGETGWGCTDDNERINILKIELDELAKRNIGFFIHMLGHSLVADGHRPEYGYVSEVGFMGCIEADGSLRKGHEIINLY